MSGFVMALYLAGLRGVSDELREAARMDGASESRIYRHIILPLLRPITASAIVLLGYTSLKMFDLVFVLTRGGPALASDLPSIFMFETTFRGSSSPQGAAVAIVMFLVVGGPDRPYIRSQLRTAGHERGCAPGRDGGPARSRRAGLYGLLIVLALALPDAAVRRRGGQPEVVRRGQLVEHLVAADVAEPLVLHRLAHAAAGELRWHRVGARQQPRDDDPRGHRLGALGLGHRATR